MLSTYAQGLLSDIGILFLGALSVYIILSTGQLSLGNGAFMGVGAYMSSVLTVNFGIPITLAALLAALTCALMGIIVGFPALRLRGIYLAIATLGFGEMVRSFFQWFDYTGGSGGFHGMPFISLGYIWTWVGIILAATILIGRSRIWLELRAVDDDETVSSLTGLNTTAIKVGAFGAGAAVAGIAGALFAHHHIYIEPGNFGFHQSIEFVLAVILGGSTVALGSLMGAGLLVLLPEFLRFLADWRMAAFGALLILVLLVRRQGILDQQLFRTLAFWRNRPRHESA